MKVFYRKKRLFFGIFFCILILFLGTFSTTVSGDASYDEALRTTPKGLSWDDGNFVIAKFPPKPANAPAKSPSGKKYSYDNNATIVRSTNPETKDTSVISLTNGTYQVGAVWSNLKKDNYFDLSHEQVASMWIYFGESESEVPGDGMAFVLQNSSQNAIALSANGIPVNGQSLGVWGADWDKTNSDPENIAKTAIQNSWAMEFDTYKNLLTQADQISGEGVSFDANNGGFYPQHIATGYPASSKTYVQHKADNTNPPIYYYTMHHDNLIGIKNLVDNNWHHITIRWSPDLTSNNQQIPTSGTMIYSYNDKNPDGSVPPAENTIATSFHLDTANFNLKNDSKLYWGFTGSTGKYYENNLMVFESIPSFVDAQATPRIHNNTQNRDISLNDKSVDPNDDISYFYTLDYKGWTKTWDKIKATINVPDNIHFTSGSVKYESTGKTYDIPSDLFTNDPRVIEDTLPDPLSHDSPKAIIELRGHTEKIATTQLKVPSAYASFDGDNLITDTHTNPFFINARLLTLKSDFPDIKNVQPNEDVNIPGELEYHDGKTLVNSNMTVYPTLNGRNLPSFRLSDDNPATGFNLHLTGEQLSQSKINMVTFHVKDNLGNTTNKITKQINIDDTGTLQFGNITPTMKFKNTNLTFPNQIIPRFDTWEVNVIDSRKKGSSWQVEAQSTDLMSATDKFNGNIIYKDESGKVNSLKDWTLIAQHYKDTDGIENKNITDGWKSQDGILLLSKANNRAGKYTSTINWSLIDSTPNK